MKASSPLPASFVIRGALVVDGSGRPEFPADVVVEEGTLRLAEPGTIADREVVNAADRIVAPGFIDVHSHADLAMFQDVELTHIHGSRLLQGVTTEVTGNCGFSPFPSPEERAAEATAFLAFVFGAAATTFPGFEEYAAAVETQGMACNVAPLVGHGTLRIAALGYEDREPTAAELARMQEALRAALAAGAFGLATGLCYTPATYAAPGEVRALVNLVAKAGAVYATHVRNETDGVGPALDEALAVAAETQVRLQVSHLKAAGHRNWGRATELLAQLDAARARGVDVTADVYPYTAGSTMLHSLLPPWLIDAGIDGMLARLADPGVRERVDRELQDGIAGWQNLGAAAGWDNVTIASASRHPEWEGRSITELGDASDRHPADTISRVLLSEGGRVVCIIEAMEAEDVRQFLGWDHTLIGSDGIPLPGTPHPRLTGTFPRVLGRCRDVFGSLAETVHRMTGAPARRFEIPRRGTIESGKVADLVVFDPDAVTDRGTYSQPWTAPAGIDHVFVGGRPAVWEGDLVDTTHGAVLRRR